MFNHFNFTITFRTRGTHETAAAQQEKNARLREAFGISEYFVEGSSFDPDRKAKEDLKRSEDIQERERQKRRDKEDGELDDGGDEGCTPPRDVVGELGSELVVTNPVGGEKGKDGKDG